MWFPLGAEFRICEPNTIIDPPNYNKIIAEVYRAQHRLSVQNEILSFIKEPRWFKGTSPPEILQDVPLTDQGVSLSLEVQTTEVPNIIRFVLTLKSGKRAVWREIEHRWTNVIPFLFAIYVNNKPVRFEKLTMLRPIKGGINAMIRLIDQGEKKQWDLRIDVKSIKDLIGDVKYDDLIFAAAFSEYQHLYPAAFGLYEEDIRVPKEFKGPAIVIRSNIVRLELHGDKWRIKQNR